MGRLVAIDYGLRRVGIATTDPLRLIATPLKTVYTADILNFLKAYTQKEDVDALVIGLPTYLNGAYTQMTHVVRRFMHLLKRHFPKQAIVPHNECLTSKIAQKSMLEAGFKQKDRRHKANLDKISATLILQSFLAQHSSSNASPRP